MFHTLSGADFALFLSVFLACAVEAVEAVTIVLAAGTARDWRSALTGVAAGLAVLAGLVVILGPSVEQIPKGALRLTIGGLLLVFGLQWLRKAILRASGFKALHDEEKIFQEEFAAAARVQKESRLGVSDWYAFTLSFKGVLLEGLEVVFIVVTFGIIQKSKNPHAFALAVWGAVIAVLLVTIAGFAIRKPLARVPENSMKFVVGIMLCSFGIFWGSEGAGAEWPHNDVALLGVIPFMLLVSFTLIEYLRARRKRVAQVRKLSLTNITPPSENAHFVVRSVGGFLYFWYDFIVGDDWRVAMAIVIGFFATHAAGASAWWLMPVVVAVALAYTLNEATRPAKVSA